MISGIPYTPLQENNQVQSGYLERLLRKNPIRSGKDSQRITKRLLRQQLNSADHKGTLLILRLTKGLVPLDGLDPEATPLSLMDQNLADYENPLRHQPQLSN